MKPLNKQFAPKSVMPEKVIQFGEGNFLRAFVDWIIWNMDQKTDFNGSVVVVQPIEKGMVDWLNAQDCLYHVNLQGRENGKAVNTLERIDVISRALNPYTQNAAFMALALRSSIICDTETEVYSMAASSPSFSGALSSVSAASSLLSGFSPDAAGTAFPESPLPPPAPIPPIRIRAIRIQNQSFL